MSARTRSRQWLFGALGWTAGALALLLVAPASQAADDHAGHAAAPGGVRRSEMMAMPMAAVTVQRQDGTRLPWRQLLDDGRPVMLNFIFTSCTAICPVTSQVFSEVRERLGRQRDQVQVVSVSIDPEYDTPKRLSDYARRFDAQGGWTFVTATQKDSVAIQQSFNAYQGDKMNHLPVTFLRAAPGKPWIRLDGFASPRQLVAEVTAMLSMAR
jgi:protein SCO1/2